MPSIFCFDARTKCIVRINFQNKVTETFYYYAFCRYEKRSIPTLIDDCHPRECGQKVIPESYDHFVGGYYFEATKSREPDELLQQVRSCQLILF